jgi:hypothetical protein
MSDVGYLFHHNAVYPHPCSVGASLTLRFNVSALSDDALLMQLFDANGSAYDTRDGDSSTLMVCVGDAAN